MIIYVDVIVSINLICAVNKKKYFDIIAFYKKSLNCFYILLFF